MIKVHNPKKKKKSTTLKKNHGHKGRENVLSDGSPYMEELPYV